MSVTYVLEKNEGPLIVKHKFIYIYYIKSVIYVILNFPFLLIFLSI